MKTIHEKPARFNLHSQNYPGLFHGKEWGRWTLDAERLVLVLDGEPMLRGEGDGEYVGFFGLNEFDVEVRSSAQLLDKIFQFRTYGYITPRDLSDLLEAVDDVLNPQGSLCSYGGDKRIENPGEFLRARIQPSERRAA